MPRQVSGKESISQTLSLKHSFVFRYYLSLTFHDSTWGNSVKTGLDKCESALSASVASASAFAVSNKYCLKSNLIPGNRNQWESWQEVVAGASVFMLRRLCVHMCVVVVTLLLSIELLLSLCFHSLTMMKKRLNRLWSSSLLSVMLFSFTLHSTLWQKPGFVLPQFSGQGRQQR